MEVSSFLYIPTCDEVIRQFTICFLFDLLKWQADDWTRAHTWERQKIIRSTKKKEESWSFFKLSLRSRVKSCACNLIKRYYFFEGDSIFEPESRVKILWMLYEIEKIYKAQWERQRKLYDVYLTHSLGYTHVPFMRSFLKSFTSVVCAVLYAHFHFLIIFFSRFSYSMNLAS